MTLNPLLREKLKQWGEKHGEDNFSRLLDRAIEAFLEAQERPKQPVKRGCPKPPKLSPVPKTKKG